MADVSAMLKHTPAVATHATLTLMDLGVHNHTGHADHALVSVLRVASPDAAVAPVSSSSTAGGGGGGGGGAGSNHAAGPAPLVSLALAFTAATPDGPPVVKLNAGFGGLKVCYLPDIVPASARYVGALLRDLSCTMSAQPLFQAYTRPASRHTPSAARSTASTAPTTSTSTTIAAAATNSGGDATKPVGVSRLEEDRRQAQLVAARSVAQYAGGPVVNVDVNFTAPFSLVVPSGRQCPNEAVVLILDGLHANLERHPVRLQPCGWCMCACLRMWMLGGSGAGVRSW